MIKREWFISTETRTKTTRTTSWRQFYYFSWRPNRVEVIEYITNLIANDLGVNIEDVSIISFNRV